MVRFGVAGMFSLAGVEVRLIEEGELMTSSRLKFLLFSSFRLCDLIFVTDPAGPTSRSLFIM